MSHVSLHSLAQTQVLQHATHTHTRFKGKAAAAHLKVNGLEVVEKEGREGKAKEGNEVKYKR